MGRMSVRKRGPKHSPPHHITHLAYRSTSPMAPSARQRNSRGSREDRQTWTIPHTLNNVQGVYTNNPRLGLTKSPTKPSRSDVVHNSDWMPYSPMKEPK